MPTEGIFLLWACGDVRSCLIPGPSNSQGPCVAQISGSKLYKIADADLFTKGASQDSSISPARGCPQGSQLSLPRARQGCLTVEMGAVFPPGAIAVFCSVAARVGSGYQHHLLRKALSALESPKRTVGHGQPGVPGRSPGPGPGR